MLFYDENDFSPNNSIGYLIRRCHLLGTNALTAAFAEEDVTHTQWQALIAIHFDRATTGADLARDLHHDKGATVRLIDGLEARGWITRTRNEEDRRCVDLALTDMGRDVAQRTKRRIIRCWNNWLADWPDAEIEKLIAMLQRLETTLADAAGQK